MTSPAVGDLVKICPGCGAQNPALAFDCVTCRFVLDNVDPSAPAASANSVSDASQASIAPTVPAPSDGLQVCPEAGCGQPNPAGSLSCLYCNQTLTKAKECESPPRLVIEWPWGIETIQGKVVIGREAPATRALAARLESQFGNVSRRHGYLLRRQAELVLCDLGSANGSFVNDVRIEANREITLKEGDSIRFASRLVAKVRKAD